MTNEYEDVAEELRDRVRECVNELVRRNPEAQRRAYANGVDQLDASALVAAAEDLQLATVELRMHLAERRGGEEAR